MCRQGLELLGKIIKTVLWDFRTLWAEMTRMAISMKSSKESLVRSPVTHGPVRAPEEVVLKLVSTLSPGCHQCLWRVPQGSVLK